MPRREPPTEGLLWMNFWGTGMVRYPHRVELFFTGSGEQAWTLHNGQYIADACYPYIFVGNHDSIDSATGHIYHPILVNGTWLNAKTLKPLPQHMIGDDAEMEHFVLPPREVYAQWDERVRQEDATKQQVPPAPATKTFTDEMQDKYDKAFFGESDAETETYEEETYTDDDDFCDFQLHEFAAH